MDAAMSDPTKPPALSLRAEMEAELRVAVEEARIDRQMAQLSAALAEARSRGDVAAETQIRQEQGRLQQRRRAL
jgi:hypothetical protein